MKRRKENRDRETVTRLGIVLTAHILRGLVKIFQAFACADADAGKAGGTRRDGDAGREEAQEG